MNPYQHAELMDRLRKELSDKYPEGWIVVGAAVNYPAVVDSYIVYNNCGCSGPDTYQGIQVEYRHMEQPKPA